MGASKSTNTVNLAIVIPEHDTEIEYEDWTTEVILPARAFYATTTYTTGLNNQSSYDRAMKDPKITWLRNLLAEIDLSDAPVIFLLQNEPNLPPILMAIDN